MPLQKPLKITNGIKNQMAFLRPIAILFAFIGIVACESESSRLETLEAKLSAIENELLDAEDAGSPSTSMIESTSTVPTPGESRAISGEEFVSPSPKVVRDEFWQTTGAGESSQVWFGLSGEMYVALEVLDRGGGAPSFSLWVYDSTWEIEPSFEFGDCCALWAEYGSVRFFDATGNGVEDIVLNYFGGKRMMGNVFTLIDGGWVDTGAFQRPEYADPGRMRITYQSCDPSCAEGDDVSSWGYWTGLEWKSCDDREAPDDCDFYWTGG